MLRIVFGMMFALCSMDALADAPAPASVPAERGVPSKPLDGEPTLAKIEASATLRVGMAVNAPWVMHDSKGELIGFEVDIAKKIAADMGWKLQLVATSWPRLITDLRTDRFDVVISGLSITPQRARDVQFSQAYGGYGITLVVNRHRFPQGGLSDVAAATHARIGARKGALTVDFARVALPGADIVEVDDEEAAIADLRSGKLDAYVGEAALPHLLGSIYPDELRALDADVIARTAHGFAMRPGDRGLQRVLDAWIVFAQASGWLKSREEYWLGGTQWADQL